MNAQKKYRVLWVDDQHNDSEMIQFIIEAEGEGLLLEGFASFEEAFENLQKNLEQFDAILLDGMFFEKKGQVAGTEDEVGIGMAIAKIYELKSEKAFPWFVLSGKEQFTRGRNSILTANKKRCFDKTNPKDVVDLFSVLKVEADQQEDTQIKHKYHKVFEVCTDKYLGTDSAKSLIDLLKSIENQQISQSTENKFNGIRKIIEKLFAAFNRIGVLPDNVFKGGGWLNNSCKFLSCSHSAYKFNGEILHPTIAFLLKNVLQLIQDGSHSQGDLKLKVDQFVKGQATSYLFNSIVFQLLDIIIWFKEFVDCNGDIAKNEALSTLLPSNSAVIYEGEIEEDSDGNFFCGDFLLNSKRVKNGFKVGDYIKVIDDDVNGSYNTKNRYSRYATKFDKK
jgi:CheY-like chemotaxis protein